jgi:hypothetical protein
MVAYVMHILKNLAIKMTRYLGSRFCAAIFPIFLTLEAANPVNEPLTKLTVQLV